MCRAKVAFPSSQNQEIVQCQWTNSSAPFYVVVSNADSSDIKIRSCPKKYDSCTGDMSKDNHYYDCDADVSGLNGGTPVLINAGVGYIVVYYKDSGKYYSVQPTAKGGLAWPGTIEVPEQTRK